MRVCLCAIDSTCTWSHFLENLSGENLQKEEAPVFLLKTKPHGRAPDCSQSDIVAKLCTYNVM